MTIHWLGLSDTPASTAPIHAIVGRTGNSLQWYKQGDELRAALEKHPGNAAVLLKFGATYDVYGLCRDLSVTYPLVTFILLVPSEGFDVKRAMRAGAFDVLSLPLNEQEMVQTVRMVENIARLRSDKKGTDAVPTEVKNARVLTICGTKGGVGKTTIAVNLSVAMSKYNLRVAVLDLDLQFGDVAIFFDMQPKRTIYEWVKEQYGSSESALDRYVIHHASGVDIFPAPIRPEFAEVVAGEHVGFLIAELKRSYDIVLIDTSPALVETGLVALENSDDILLVTSLELPTLKNTKLCLETLETLGLRERVKVILNRDTDAVGIPFESVENVLGTPVYARIPSEGKVVVPSVNKGVPFVTSNPHALTSKCVFAMAKTLQGVSPSPRAVVQAKKSIIGRWASR